MPQLALDLRGAMETARRFLASVDDLDQEELDHDDDDGQEA